MSKAHKARKCSSGGFEIAISRKDLWIKGKSGIIEGHSTKGFEEDPIIKFPNRYGPTNSLIQHDQHWSVVSKWKVYGPLACLLDCGRWKAKVYFELMGGGETSYSPEVVVQDVGQSGHAYKAKINIRPGALKPGVYRVVCCLQYYLKKGSPGPIAGFHDLGLVKIYQDKKETYRPHTELAPVVNGVG